MVEVFKTDVNCPFMAQQIIADILAFFVDVEVNFDLEDKDCILRVQFGKDILNAESYMQQIIRNYNCKAEQLNNDIQLDLTINPLVFSGENIGLDVFFNIF